MRLRNGEPAALGELYDLVGRRAFGLARRVLGDPAAAEDAVQEAFAQLWEQAPRLALEGRIDSLVMTMVHRRAVDMVRRRRGGSATLDASAVLAQIDERAEAVFEHVLDALSEASLRASLRASLDALPEPQRRVVQGVYFEALTLREVAAREQIPVGTAKSRLRLAMAKLTEAVKAQVPR